MYSHFCFYSDRIVSDPSMRSGLGGLSDMTSERGVIGSQRPGDFLLVSLFCWNWFFTKKIISKIAIRY